MTNEQLQQTSLKELIEIEKYKLEIMKAKTEALDKRMARLQEILTNKIKHDDSKRTN